MPDPSAFRSVSNTAPLRVATAPVGALLRLKSWRDGAIPLSLDRGQWPAHVGDTLNGPIRVQCVAPGDWLILSHQFPSAELRKELQAGLPEGLVLVDMSDAFASLEITGSAARDVLSKGCCLDFHPRVFLVGRCARTRFAQMPVVLECLDDTPRFEMTVARSYHHYLHSWLVDASVEFRDR